MKTTFWLSIPCGISLWILTVSAARADLLVMLPGGGGTYKPHGVLRLDDRTGAFINQFSTYTENFGGMALGPDEKIYVTGNFMGGGTVYRFSRTGAFLGTFAFAGPGNLTFGPDGNLYAIGTAAILESPLRYQIPRYNGSTGKFMDYFVAPGSGGTRLMVDLAFGRDGHLYVADYYQGIMRYNGSTGEFMDTFVPAGSAGVSGYFGFIFGPDGNLYVRSYDSNAVVRFDGNSGAFLDYFVAPGSGGLNGPGGLAFGPDGNLYVSSSATDQILRYDGHTGAFLDVFATDSAMSAPANLVFTPPLPRLQINSAGEQAEISWPSFSSPRNWTLTKQRSLEATNEWTEVTNAPTLVGTNYFVTDRRDAIATFYRLEQH